VGVFIVYSRMMIIRLLTASLQLLCSEYENCRLTSAFIKFTAASS